MSCSFSHAFCRGRQNCVGQVEIKIHMPYLASAFKKLILSPDITEKVVINEISNFKVSACINSWTLIEVLGRLGILIIVTFSAMYRLNSD